jgi:hypothetical protein
MQPPVKTKRETRTQAMKNFIFVDLRNNWGISSHLWVFRVAIISMEGGKRLSSMLFIPSGVPSSVAEAGISCT